MIKQAISGLGVDAYFAIGVANRRYISCPLEAANDYSRYYIQVGGTLSNRTVNAFSGFYTVPLPSTIGTKKLYVDRIRVGLYDADDNDFLTNISLFNWTAHNIKTTEFTDATDKKIIEEVDYDPPAAIDLGSSKKTLIQAEIATNVAYEFELSYVQVRYYYDD